MIAPMPAALSAIAPIASANAATNPCAPSKPCAPVAKKGMNPCAPAKMMSGAA
jgi:uncharacterized membrane protein